MFNRTRDAIQFLNRCKDAVAPFVCKKEGIPVPANAGKGDGVELTGSDPVIIDAYHRLTDTLTGEDVIESIVSMRAIVDDSQSSIARIQEELSISKEETSRLTIALSTGSGAPGSVRESEAMVTLRKQVAELTERNASLQSRVTELNKELSAATAAAARAARLVGSSTGMSANARADAEELALCRARIRELEANFDEAKRKAASASDEMQVRLRELSTALDAERRKNGTYAASSAASASTRTQQVTSSTSSAAPSANAESLWEHEWLPFLTEAQKLEKEGAYNDAEQQYVAVLEAKRDRCGGESVAVATACRDLGRILALQRRFDKSEEYYATSVRLCSSLLGEDHPNTACALTDLAAVLREQAKFEDAEVYARRAVSSLRAGVGANDVSTATALYNLAGLAKRQGKFKDAEDAYSEALVIFRERLGDSQAETSDTLYQLGCLYRKRNEYNKAKLYFSQAADAYAKCFGSSDKRVAEASKRAKAMAEKISNLAASNVSG
jgi:tetratricopeptide (TPR) repeat protein